MTAVPRVPPTMPPRMNGRRMPKRDMHRSDSLPAHGLPMRANDTTTPLTTPITEVASSGYRRNTLSCRVTTAGARTASQIPK